MAPRLVTLKSRFDVWMTLTPGTWRTSSPMLMTDCASIASAPITVTVAGALTISCSTRDAVTTTVSANVTGSSPVCSSVWSWSVCCAAAARAGRSSSVAATPTIRELGREVSGMSTSSRNRWTAPIRLVQHPHEHIRTNRTRGIAGRKATPSGGEAPPHRGGRAPRVRACCRRAGTGEGLRSPLRPRRAARTGR